MGCRGQTLAGIPKGNALGEGAGAKLRLGFRRATPLGRVAGAAPPAPGRAHNPSGL